MMWKFLYFLLSKPVLAIPIVGLLIPQLPFRIHLLENCASLKSLKTFLFLFLSTITHLPNFSIETRTPCILVCILVLPAHRISKLILEYRINTVCTMKYWMKIKLSSSFKKYYCRSQLQGVIWPYVILV